MSPVIPAFSVEKGRVTDRDIALRMAADMEHETACTPQETDTRQNECSKGDNTQENGPELPETPSHSRVATGKASATSVQPNDDVSESAPELAFLADVREHPDSGIAARYKRLGISVRQGQKLKARLLDNHLIEDREIRTKTGRLRVIRLTEKARRR